jgi:hypothetical protein
MSITSKPVGLGATFNALGNQLNTLERKLNKLEAQLVRATAAQAATGNTGIVPQQAAGGNTGIVPQQAASGNTGIVPTAASGNTGIVPTGAGQASYDYQKNPRSINDLFKILAGPGTPTPSEGSHPSGSLKADPSTGVVTTPGGYKIEQLGQFDWKISGPDGKETKIWGDPHVAEGDGGKWDFKKDSTFVLGDGTRINVTTKPYGNGMTVTGGLDIISGNDRVQVTDIDKGKGKTGQVTHDGFQHVNDFGGKDVFVMGKETDDWSYTGKEIVGSNNGGDSFKLGKDLAPGTPTTKPAPNGSADQLLKQMRDIFKGLSNLFSSMSKLTDQLSKRFAQDGGLHTRPGAGDWLNRRQDRLRNDFDNIGRMLHLFKGLEHLTKAVQPFRNTFTA